MATRKPKLDAKSGEFVNPSISPIAVEKPTNNWDSETERLKQELAYYEGFEAKIISQLLKETNGLLAMLRMKQGRLCQLDRQYLRTKLTLMMSKVEASEMAEQQAVKIKTAARSANGT